MENLKDFMYTLVNEEYTKRGKYLTGEKVGGLVSRAPDTLKRILAESLKYI